MRYTEYHAGKAVIRDKNLLPDAMQKLAEVEDIEQEGPILSTAMLMVERVREDICDNYCKYRETGDDDGVCDVIRDGGICPLDLLR